MGDRDVRNARDYGGEIHRSWRRTLKPLWMPAGMKSKEVRIAVDPKSIFAESLRNGKTLASLDNLIRSFDWHSQVSIRFAEGEGGAGWSRSSRTITVHDEYLDRFNRQGKEAATARARTNN